LVVRVAINGFGISGGVFQIFASAQGAEDPIMTIRNNDTVGIGKTTPFVTLDVEDSAITTGGYITNMYAPLLQNDAGIYLGLGKSPLTNNHFALGYVYNTTPIKRNHENELMKQLWNISKSIFSDIIKWSKGNRIAKSYQG